MPEKMVPPADWTAAMPRLVTPGVNNLFAMARCRAVASLDADKVRTSHQGLDLVPTWVLTSRNGLAYVLAYGGIPLAARGSATASLVVWALGLSELCPLDYDLDGRMLASDNDSCILGPFCVLAIDQRLARTPTCGTVRMCSGRWLARRNQV